jgi:hypothetical protein
MGRAEGGLAHALPPSTVAASLCQPVPPHRGGLVAAPSAVRVLRERHHGPPRVRQTCPTTTTSSLLLMADDATWPVWHVWLCGCVAVVVCRVAVLGCVGAEWNQRTYTSSTSDRERSLNGCGRHSDRCSLPPHTHDTLTTQTRDTHSRHGTGIGRGSCRGAGPGRLAETLQCVGSFTGQLQACSGRCFPRLHWHAPV